MTDRDDKLFDAGLNWLKRLQEQHPGLDPVGVGLYEQFHRVAYAVRRLAERGVTDQGLSLPRVRLLGLLTRFAMAGQQGPNPSTISDLLGLSRNAVSALVRTLEDDGLIKRRVAQADRRRFELTLTTKGRAVAEAQARQHVETIADAFTALTPAEQKELARLLGKLEEAGQVPAGSSSREAAAGTAPRRRAAGRARSRKRGGRR